MTVLKTLTRILLSCVFVVAAMGASTAKAIEPSTMSVTPGQERDWLLEKYVATAHFELRAGKVVVWEPTSGDATGPLVEFGGVFDDEAARVLGELLQKGRIHTLSLASPGGLVVPTLKLGRAIKAKGITTVVETGRGCYSACALLYLAGHNRILGKESKDWLNRPSAAVVGFHAPYTLGADGVARHLQDIKTSSSCAYIRELLSKPAATELCDYMLATKGMATFSFEEGKRLQIYTDSESDVVLRWSEAVAATATADENQWVMCERFKKFLERWPSKAGDGSLERYFPCAGGLTPQAPTPQSRHVELAKVARALGPSNIPKEVMSAAYQMLADRTVLTAYEQHYISCKRSFRWLYQQDKVPPLNQMLNPKARSAEFEVWWKACPSERNFPEGRNIEGFGYVSQTLTMFMLDEVARRQGVNWPPPEPPRMR